MQGLLLDQWWSTGCTPGVWPFEKHAGPSPDSKGPQGAPPGPAYVENDITK